ncbi:DUF3575 domain-containing protein [Aquirufa rosea]|uniref:DUF3575 domain-containing protein n=1 Tax=Aquirufa rosea TaxID=2509241 RepID=A0A4Q1C0J4_9BACT|nr:DUF3575 domain-containing protein [Aquirufa rosea]RXK50645.1 DUF3575 domain-containing protein [Aquirufa rosea]
MKKIICVLLIIPNLLFAQNSPKNSFKVNLSSLLLKNYNFTYERSLSKHWSFSLGVRTMPFGNVPFEQSISEQIDDQSINLKRLQLGNTAITPEIRYYFSSKGNQGFYVAPYGRYLIYEITAPITVEDKTNGQLISIVDRDFKGKITSMNGGLMFGVQYPIWKNKMVLDFWIVGAHFGTSTGTLTAEFKPALTQQEQDLLQREVDNLDISPFKSIGKVSANNAQINTDGPWVGVRGLGLNIGFKF